MQPYHLFDVFGVELEYMIVDRNTLEIRPIVDKVIHEMTGEFTNDVDRGEIAWSNELVSHVLELKTNGPKKSLIGLQALFHSEVVFINQLLEKHNAMLMPTGAHPFFHPDETVIWPHEYNEVYALYDRIFSCKGHGWSNLQSTHINLPFANDNEFALLHGAIRIILPIIPALAASTPIIESQVTGIVDTRLDYYMKNQQKIPEIAGAIIPEPAFSKRDYEQMIFDPIARAIAPYDTEKVLDKHFLNSRGAIARFDRGAIEIRLVDIQECPKADLAIVEILVATIQWLIEQHQHNFEKNANTCSTSELSDLLKIGVKKGSAGYIDNLSYLSLFDANLPLTMMELWQFIVEAIKPNLSNEAIEVFELISSQGNLSERIVKRISEANKEESIDHVYNELAVCLDENRMFKL